MNIKILRNLAIASLFLSMLMWPAPAPALVVNCPAEGPASGAMVDDVIVNTNLLCTLNNVTVRGSVLVSGGGTLTATGGTEVRGSIKVDSGPTIGPGTVAVDLADATVLGDVTLKDSGDVTVGAAATIGTLKLESSGGVVASGNLGSIESIRSKGVKLDGATVFPGGVTLVDADGSLVICGSTIEGVVSVELTDGDVLVDHPSITTCLTSGPSTIDSSVIVLKGTGNVRLEGATLTAGDLIVIEQAGDVDVQNTSLSDVKVEKLRDPNSEDVGNVTFSDVTTDSDTTIVDITGNVMITGTDDPSIVGGDLEIKSAGNVTLNNVMSTSDTSITDNGDVFIHSSQIRGDLKITSNVASDPVPSMPRGVILAGNNFFFEDISISKNKGPITVGGPDTGDENVNLSLSIVENNGVQATDKVEVTGNTFTDAEVSKNTDYSDIEITGNTGDTLHCSDNDPAPNATTGMSNNTIPLEFTTGQCTGFGMVMP